MVEHDYIQETRTQRLRNWIMSEMLRGAGYALTFMLAILVIYLIIWGIGQFLPAESKNAPPPRPFSAYEAPMVRALT